MLYVKECHVFLQMYVSRVLYRKVRHPVLSTKILNKDLNISQSYSEIKIQKVKEGKTIPFIGQRGRV